MVVINIYIASISCIAIFYIIAHFIIIADNSIRDESNLKNSISETITIVLFTSLGISLASSIFSYFITFFIKN
jgi:hypothetical protein